MRSDPERTAALNDLAREFVADSDADIRFLDIRELTCPDGEYVETIDGVQLHRDGVHYTDEAIPLVWEWLVDELEKIATGQP